MMTLIAAALIAAVPADAHGNHSQHQQGHEQHTQMKCCEAMKSGAKMDCCKGKAEGQKAKACCTDEAKPQAEHKHQ